MGERAEVESPIIQLRCIYCGYTTEPSRHLGDIEIEEDEKFITPALDMAIWHLRDGTKVKDGSILPSICPGCIGKGLPYPEDWTPDEEENEVTTS